MFGLDEDDSTILSIGVIGFLTLLAGCASGLTLSLFSLDETYLKALSNGPESKDKRRAENVLSVTRSPHWLLVTLLLVNAGCVEGMPMLIDEILDPIMAIVISVTLVLIFGEVIPQALFIRHALVIGSIFSYPLRFLMYLTAPVSWTVGKLLDTLVGHRSAVFFRRRELREFLVLQQEMLQGPDDGDTGPRSNATEEDNRKKISDQEIAIMLGALSLSETYVEDSDYKKLSDTFKLDEEAELNKEMCDRIFNCGYSRILVYRKSNNNNNQQCRITGFIVAKTLLSLIYHDSDKIPKVRDLPMYQPHYCSTDDKLSEVYQSMQVKSCHIAVVQGGDVVDDKNSPSLGIITAHDILERIHRCNFSDETDLRQGAPVQFLMKSWNTMQLRKNILASGPLSVHATGGGGGTPASMRNTRASGGQPLSRRDTQQHNHLGLAATYHGGSAYFDSPSQNGSFRTGPATSKTRSSGKTTQAAFVGSSSNNNSRARSKSEREMLTMKLLSSPTSPGPSQLPNFDERGQGGHGGRGGGAATPAGINRGHASVYGSM